MSAPVVAGAAAKEVGKALVGALAAYAGSKMLDAILDPGPVFNNPDPSTPISEQNPATIASNITFAPSIEISPEMRQDTSTALNTLATSEANAAAFESAMAAFQAKVAEETNTRIESANELDAEVIRKVGTPDNTSEIALTDESKKKLRAIQRRNSDRLFASKEEHEYRYVNTKGKIDQVFALAGVTKTNVGTYGTWVDVEEMRRAIELVRRLRRVAYGCNAKALTGALGTTRELLLEQLASATVVQQQLDAACNAWNAH